MKQVQLRVQRMAKEEFDDDFACSDLYGETTQTTLVFVRRHTRSELVAELFCQPLLQPQSGLVVKPAIRADKAPHFSLFFVRQLLHSDEQSAALTFPAVPTLDERVELLPAAQVEITDTEISVCRCFERVAECREQFLLDVVEDAWQCFSVLPEDSWLDQLKYCGIIIVNFNTLRFGLDQSLMLTLRDAFIFALRIVVPSAIAIRALACV